MSAHEAAGLMLNGNAFKIAQADCVSQKRRFLAFGKPRGEITWVVLTRGAESDFFLSAGGRLHEFGGFLDENALSRPIADQTG